MEHAEAITNAQKEAFADMANARDIATKKDILLVKTELQQVKSELQIELAKVKADLIKWFMGTALAIIGVMLAGFAIVISLIR